MNKISPNKSQNYNFYKEAITFAISAIVFGLLITYIAHNYSDPTSMRRIYPDEYYWTHVKQAINSRIIGLSTLGMLAVVGVGISFGGMIISLANIVKKTKFAGTGKDGYKKIEDPKEKKDITRERNKIILLTVLATLLLITVIFTSMIANHEACTTISHNGEDSYTEFSSLGDRCITVAVFSSIGFAVSLLALFYPFKRTKTLLSCDTVENNIRKCNDLESVYNLMAFDKNGERTVSFKDALIADFITLDQLAFVDELTGTLFTLQSQKQTLTAKKDAIPTISVPSSSPTESDGAKRLREQQKAQDESNNSEKEGLQRSIQEIEKSITELKERWRKERPDRFKAREQELTPSSYTANAT